LKRFAFVNEAATREYKDLPGWIQDEFGKDLMRVQYSGDPQLAIKQLRSLGPGVTELIINGSPAYRCIYIAKYADTIFVLHSFVKTTNRTDRHAMAVAQDRLKELKRELRNMGFNV
jgi:phage-related protein